jgi:hypothetical protein
MPQPNLNPDSIRIRELRRMIMQSLNTLFPSKAYVRTLWRIVIGIEPTYDKSMFVKDVFYLQAKGYVALTKSPLAENGKVEEQFILLTASGKEIAEQTMSDPALEI